MGLSEVDIDTTVVAVQEEKKIVLSTSKITIRLLELLTITRS